MEETPTMVYWCYYHCIRPVSFKCVIYCTVTLLGLSARQAVDICFGCCLVKFWVNLLLDRAGQKECVLCVGLVRINHSLMFSNLKIKSLAVKLIMVHGCHEVGHW